MDANALLSHILHQTRQNVEFLVVQKQLTYDAGQDILKKIPSSPVHVESRSNLPTPSTATNSISDLERRTSIFSISPSGAAATTTTVQSTTHSVSLPNPTAPAYPQPPLPQDPPVLFQAKALWDYSQDPADLSFRTGDIISVTAETNADWWTGLVRDNPHKKQGLFPSNYVERIPGPPPSASTPFPPPPQSIPHLEKAPTYGDYQPYQPSSGPPASNHGGYSLSYPSPGPPVGYYSSAPPPSGPVVPATQPPQPTEEPHKKKFGGKYRDTLAHSAVGGLGFGAGSAVASNIVNSIF